MNYNKYRNKEVDTTVFTVMFMILMFCVGITLFAVKMWLIGSLLTSTVKATTDNCHNRYFIEGFVQGNWFCPKD